MFTLADGSDHGGSLRGPAAFCGVVGFRTCPGRVPAYPSAWVYDTFSVPGPMARNVRDVALLLSVMAGPDSRAPLSIAEPGAPFATAAEGGIAGWRVAYSPDLDGLLTLDDEVRRVTGAAMQRWDDLGCTLEQACPDLSLTAEIIPPLRAMRTAVVRQPQLDRVAQIDNQGIKDYLELAGQLSGLELARAEWGRSQVWEKVNSFFERYDLLLLPTTQMNPFPKEQALPPTVGGRPTGELASASLATYAISITNLPAMSVPCGFTADGLPVGLQIVGGWRREAAVLRAAATFEDAFPWSQHRPPMVG
jgi:amidase